MKKTNISKFVAVGLCICALTGCGASPDEKRDYQWCGDLDRLDNK